MLMLKTAGLLTRVVGPNPVAVISSGKPEVVNDNHDLVAVRTERHTLVPDLPKIEACRFITDKSKGPIAGAVNHSFPLKESSTSDRAPPVRA